MSEAQKQAAAPAQPAPAVQPQVAIPPVPVNLPLPAVDTILRGLGKLPYEEVADVADSLRSVTQAHVQRCVAAHEAAQAQAAKAAPGPKAQLKPTASAVKTAARPTAKRRR